MKRYFIFSLALCFGMSVTTTVTASASALPTTPTTKHVILFVWDGLRADAISETKTPNLYHLTQQGVLFQDNHSTYPTFTMMNAASFATGDRAGNTGFYGNTLWHPGVHGADANGKTVDFQQPVFTEDYKILEDLNQDQLFFAPTLFEAAHQQHLTTVTIGKTGPAFMQDYHSNGVILDEKHVYPLAFAKTLQKNHYGLPKTAPLTFQQKQLVLHAKNGNPTSPKSIVYLADGVTPDASDAAGSPFSAANGYMMNVFLQEILPKQQPTLAVVWMRNPDTTEHFYGPGSQNYQHALHDNDVLLGDLLATLDKLHLRASTDIVIVSDHAHSTISGSLQDFPLRLITQHGVGAVDANGYSVSGNVRLADLLTRAGFHAYDGIGCEYAPVLSGIKADGTRLHPTLQDKTGRICGKAGELYTSPAYKVPLRLPRDAIVVAANGGTDYMYVPSHDKTLVAKLVRFLQSNMLFDSVFVDATRYGGLPGTIPLATIGLQNSHGRSPDIIVGFAYDAKAIVQGMPGTGLSDWPNMRGNHGSFSPVDVHNFLAASGPDFRQQFRDTLPTGNVDVAPTIAYLLGMTFTSEGRVLHEALVNDTANYSVQQVTLLAGTTAEALTVVDSVNQPVAYHRYRAAVNAKLLSADGKEYLYFDSAHAERK